MIHFRPSGLANAYTVLAGPTIITITGLEIYALRQGPERHHLDRVLGGHSGRRRRTSIGRLFK